MAFSNEWEKQYAQGKQFSLYPWSDLVSMVMRFAHPKQFSHHPKVLEIGCGVGANVSFFLDKKFDYYAIEGSQTATRNVQQRWGDSVNVLCEDFTKSLPYNTGFFDLVVDRSSIHNNPVEAISQVIKSVKSVLKKGHVLIVSDWFSADDLEFGKGEQFEENTCLNYQSGSYADIGITHFFTKKEILALFDQWQILFLEHKTYEAHIPQNGGKMARWNLVAKNLE